MPATARRRALLVAVAVLVLVLVVGVVLVARWGGESGQGSAADPTASPSPSGSTTPDPVPTPSAGSTEPAGTPAPTPGPESDPVTAEPPPPAPPGTVPVTVTFWGYDPGTSTAQVGGYAGVIETGGTCTLTLTLADSRATTSAPAVPDATTTTCGTLVVPRDDLVAGSWSAVLSYNSPTVSGSAPAVTIEVP